ncbi:Sensor histidine kinase RcsC [compost metagenome]
MSRILLVDSYPIIRRAMRLKMEADGHQVVGETDNSREALLLCRQSPVDLVVLDLAIPQSGLELIRRLKTGEPVPKILVYSAGDVGHMAARSLQAGADGFVSKQADPLELRNAMLALLQGRSYFPHEALPELRSGPATHPGDALQQLSPREFAVLQLLVRGVSNQTISQQLAISFKTVSTYKHRLMEKLHAGSLVELADIARRHGLLAGEGGEVAVDAPAPENPMLQRILDVMPMRTHVSDLDGHLLFCNQAFCDFTGLTFEQMRGRRLIDLGVFSRERASSAADRHLEMIRRGEPYTLEVALDVNGRQHVIQHWGVPYHDAQGTLLGMICGGVDVTEREAQMLQLSEARQQAEAGNRAKTHFLERIGAVLHTPLGALANNLRQLRDVRTLDQRGLATVQRAERTVQGLLRLSTDLGDLVRLERGQLHLEAQVVDVRALTEAGVREFADEARQRGLELRCELAEARVASVWVEPRRYAQILRKLLGNALKFTPQGWVAVGLQTVRRGQAQVELILEVADSGVGIAVDDIPLLFEPFSQIPDHAGIARGESGLGLALCKRLAEAMGGDLELHSELGVGTRVLLRLQVPLAAGRE